MHLSRAERPSVARLFPRYCHLICIEICSKLEREGEAIHSIGGKDGGSENSSATDYVRHLRPGGDAFPGGGAAPSRGRHDTLGDDRDGPWNLLCQPLQLRGL